MILPWKCNSSLKTWLGSFFSLTKDWGHWTYEQIQSLGIIFDRLDTLSEHGNDVNEVNGWNLSEDILTSLFFFFFFPSLLSFTLLSCHAFVRGLRNPVCNTNLLPVKKKKNRSKHMIWVYSFISHSHNSLRPSGWLAAHLNVVTQKPPFLLSYRFAILIITNVQSAKREIFLDFL